MRELGIMCGSVALLIAVAVFIKVGAPVLAKAWVIYITNVAYTPVEVGGNTTISWYAGSAQTCSLTGPVGGPGMTCLKPEQTRFFGNRTFCYATVYGTNPGSINVGNIVTGPITGPTSYTISCHSPKGCSFGCNDGDGITGLTVYPITPTALSTFSANPSSVLSGNTTVLSWGGTRGTYFSKCQLSGGQWGSGTDISGGIPNQVTTQPITTATTYSLRCFDTRYGWSGPLTTTVNLAAPVTADATATTPIRVGETATISFHADSTDPPTNCRINNYNDTVVLKTTAGGCASTLDASYITPAYTAPGDYSYKFYYYRNGWFLAKTVGVRVNPTSCPAGQILNQAGTACVPGCSNGLNPSYAPSCTCPSGQTQSGAICVAIPTSCTNGLDPRYLPSCACPSGRAQSGTECVAPGSINNLSSNPTRVRKGGTITLSWSTSNMDSCTLRGPAAGVVSALSSALSGTLSRTVTNQSVYTLTCVDSIGTSRTQSATVNIVPETIEQ